MTTTVPYTEQKSGPPKMGWGELSFYVMSAFITIVGIVVVTISGVSKEDMGGASERHVAVLVIFCGAFFWFIALGLGSFLLKKTLNKKGIVPPYQRSRLLVLLRSDLICYFFTYLPMMVLIFFVALTSGKPGALALLRVAAGMGTAVISLIAWYPSLRYVLNKEGLYQPGLIKSYVWMWCKWVFFPIFALSCAIALFFGVR